MPQKSAPIGVCAMGAASLMWRHGPRVEIGVTSANGEWHLAWDDFLKWNESDQLFVFYQAPRLFNVVPKRVLTAEQVDDLRQCAGRIGANA